MRCREIMHKVECCFLDDPVADIASRMRSLHVGFMPVCNQAGEIIGTITDRDLTVRVLGDRLRLDTPVQGVMSMGPVTCSPSDRLEEAEHLMERFYKWRIVCVDDKNRPVGVISLSDIAEVERASRAGRLLRQISSREVRLI